MRKQLRKKRDRRRTHCFSLCFDYTTICGKDWLQGDVTGVEFKSLKIVGYTDLSKTNCKTCYKYMLKDLIEYINFKKEGLL